MSRPSLFSSALRPAWIEYLRAVALVTAATLLGGAVFGRQYPADVVMLYLLASVLVSMRSGYGASVFAAVLAVLAFDVFFIPPYLSVTVADVRHALTFVIMFVVAMTINSLTMRVRAQAEAACLREKRTEALYAMSRDLAKTIDASEAAEVAARHVRGAFGGSVAVHAGDGEPAQLVHRSGEASDRAQDRVLPLVATRGRVGTLTLTTDRGTLTDAEQHRLLEAFASQLAVALERSRLETERQTARMEAVREQLKNTLLSSVSHDLRTPLTTVIGATSALLEQRSLPDTARRELLESVHEEALRLDRLVGNLLAMTRLEAGSIAIRRELQPLEEVVGVVLNRLESRLSGRTLDTVLPPDLPPVDVDGLLVEQLLTNLIENAIRHTPPDCPIEIRARAVDGAVQVEVADRGPGIPIDQREKVFDKFHRLNGDRASSGGVGLGLAICRAIVDAHGGRIQVDEATGGGARFTFTLPTRAMQELVA